MKHVISGVLCCLLSWCYAQGQSKTDSIITTKGAVTLITCGAAISTFQIGDGKNADYDYRIVDGNLVFIRPIVANPKTTNLVVREGENVHYLILTFDDEADLGRLKYTLSGGSLTKGANRSAGNNNNTPVPVTTDDEAPAPVDIDTVTVSKIADDFMRQKKGSHQYETKADGITLNFSQAMSLNKLAYLSFRLKNRSGKPYAIAKVTLMHKVNKDSAKLHAMPVLYKKEPAAIAGREEQNIVYVVSKRDFKKGDEIILVLYNSTDQNQLVLYTPVSALPKYMVSK